MTDETREMDNQNISADGKIRAVTKSGKEDYGDVVIVNEGSQKMDMDVHYLKVGEDGDSLHELSDQEAMKEVVGIDDNKLRKMRRELGEDYWERAAKKAPDWIQGVVDDEPLDAEDWKIEYEPIIGGTALARRYVEDQPEETEEWVLTFNDGGMALTAKLEMTDRFEDEEWQTYVEGSGRVEKDVREMPGEHDMKPIEVTTVQDFEYDEIKTHRIEEDRIREALKGVVEKRFDPGDQFDYTVETFDGSGFFRINIGPGDMYYYWISDPATVEEFRIPQWAIRIADTDDVIDL